MFLYVSWLVAVATPIIHLHFQINFQVSDLREFLICCSLIGEHLDSFLSILIRIKKKIKYLLSEQ